VKNVGMASYVAGCDICQEVCPFNFKAMKLEVSEGELATSSCALDILDWDELVKETFESYEARVRDSALSRVKAIQMKRNLDAVSHHYSANLSP
jgi:epoxyqueuosine reductase